MVYVLICACKAASYWFSDFTIQQNQIKSEQKMEPLVHLCVTKKIIQPADLWAVRWLTENDAPAFAEPFGKNLERGWTLEEFRQLQESGYSYCGILMDGRLCSIAGLWKRASDVWEVIAVGTKEDHRRQGMARSVVYFIADYILQNVQVASYTSRETNIASIRTAESIGFVYCTNTINDEKWCVKNPRPPVEKAICPLRPQIYAECVT